MQILYPRYPKLLPARNILYPAVMMNLCIQHELMSQNLSFHYSRPLISLM